MAWTAPRTWVTGETVTAALLNTHLRDNLNATGPGVVTTKGDLLAATAASTLARLAVGSDGALLVADSAATPGMRWTNTAKVAAAGYAAGAILSSTLTAAANSDALYNLYAAPVYASGTYTGLNAYLLYLDGTSATKTGTGTLAGAYGLFISPPTIGTTNWSLYISGGNSVLGDTASKVFIGDTANANMSAGLTINQGASDDEAFALKSSDVAHGVTDYAETDTYGFLKKTDANLGGVALWGFGESGHGVTLVGVQTSGDNTRSTAATGALQIFSYIKNGTGIAALGADTNILTVASGGNCRFILDSDGDSHQDVGTAWTNYDEHDDVSLLNKASAHLTRANDPLKRTFGKWLKTERAELERLKLVTFNDDGHHFANWSRFHMLEIGAIRQIAKRLEALEGRINA